MKIGLDYDKTYSADPTFWKGFIQLATAIGHDVRIVTVRDDRLDRTAPLVEVEQTLPVIYTRGVAKKWYCEHFGEGFVPEIWIDDNPATILANSTLTPDALAEWRETRDEPDALAYWP